MILSDELTNTRAAAIGMITITTAKNILLKKALSEGVINLEIQLFTLSLILN